MCKGLVVHVNKLFVPRVNTEKMLMAFADFYNHGTVLHKARMHETGMSLGRIKCFVNAR